VSCTGKASTCLYTAPTAGKRYLVFQRGHVKVGVYSVMRADLGRLVLRRSSGSVTVDDPVSWSRKIIKKLRQDEKVDVIVAMANLNVESDSPSPVLDYIRELGGRGPDIVLASSMFERGSPKFYLRQIRRGKTLVIGTDRFGRHLARVKLSLTHKAGRYVVSELSVKQHELGTHPKDAWVAAKLKMMMKALCAKVSQPLGKGYFAAPISYAGFLGYMMEVMRRRTRAEVAVINDSGIADTSFPMSGKLTWEKVLRAIRTQTDIGYVLVQGSRLKKLLGAHLGDSESGLHVLGLTKKGGWRVNGRKLVSGHLYRLALTGFIAAGGDDLLKLGGAEKYKSIDVSLRDAATRFFAADGEASYDRKLDVNPKRDFPDLSKRWLLRGSIDVGFGLANVAVKNPSTDVGGNREFAYSLPLLNRDNVTTLSANLDIALGASTIDHALELDVSFNYGHTWTTSQSNNDRFDAESLDRITGSLLYRLPAIRNHFDKARYVPEPYIEGRFITEFTASGVCDVCTDPADASYHYFDLGGTAGIGFTLHPLFFIKMGLVLRGELLTPDQKNPDIKAKPGIYLGYLLRRWKLFARTMHPASLESRLDFYFTDLSGDLRRELTMQSKITLALTRYISLAVNHRLYIFDKRGEEMGIGNDISLGLALSYDFRRQTF
jgi:hypothetical protein